MFAATKAEFKVFIAERQIMAPLTREVPFAADIGYEIRREYLPIPSKE